MRKMIPTLSWKTPTLSFRVPCPDHTHRSRNERVGVCHDRVGIIFFSGMWGSVWYSSRRLQVFYVILGSGVVRHMISCHTVAHSAFTYLAWQKKICRKGHYRRKNSQVLRFLCHSYKTPILWYSATGLCNHNRIDFEEMSSDSSNMAYRDEGRI